MYKVRIGPIHGRFCANLGSELCTVNLWIVHVLTHTTLNVFMCMLIEQWPIVTHSMLDGKRLPFHKEGQEQGDKKETGKGNEVL